MAVTKLREVQDETVEIGHNSDEIKKIIQEVVEEIIGLKAKKAEIQAEITEARSRVKGQGIKMADFNVALRLAELETEDRNDALDGLRICFEALGIGEQGELFPAVADQSPI